ncbi:MAG: aldo/keto reductase [Candidatus Thorarchaeota archaeon]|nr:MAG: aldo/keto reductase [Candidatus Thorarchaeota archaeon]RLI59589.1 MAG: aldo/keto reductase [Candidatus Thorarchaeota archaeon]
MRYRRVGRSGLKISEISLGSWLTYGGSVENEMAKKCMATALDNGINFIDSAEIYARGKAEEVIAEFLLDETVDRRNLVISSKVFWPTSEDINDWGNSRKNVMNAIDGTLSRLNLDYIDIYYLHRYDYTTPLKETVSVMDDLIRSGKVRYWGTSVWTAAQLERANAVAKELGAHKPIVEQPMYNMLSRYIELEIMPVAQTHGMGFTVWSPLAQGLLTGKYNEGIPDGSRGSRSDSIKKRLTPDLISKLKKLGEIAESLDLTMGQLALAWILRRKEISAAIVGATRPEHVIENVAASGVNLSSSTLEEIHQVLDNEPEWPPTYAPNMFYEDRMA